MRIVTILAGGLLLASCASGIPVISSGDRYISSAAPTEYRLGAGDRIRVSVFNEPTLSGEFQIGAQGAVVLPLVGEVAAAGRTPAEVAEEDRAKLGAGFVNNPRVGVEVVVYRPFFILGEVAQGGQYPYVPGLTAMNAVATARGYTPRSERQIILIRREGEAVENAYRVTPDLRVFPGDTIRVKERWF